MGRAHFRFYAELNDFLAPVDRFQPLARDFETHTSVKDAIESTGVPHTEVDLIVANGSSVDFSYRLKDGDRISVYPVFESVDVSDSQRLRPRPLRSVDFVVDANLGRLARYLRLLGFDTLYRRDFQDAELAEISAREGRVLLTRDVGVLKRSAVTRGYYVRATEPRAQVVEVLARFDLAGALETGTRCVHCNGAIEAVETHRVQHIVRDGTRRAHDRFWRCSGCGRIYWRGAHYRRTAAFVDEIRRRLAEGRAREPANPP